MRVAPTYTLLSATNKSIIKKKIVQSPFCHMLAHLIISHLKVTHGLCDLMYTNTEVVLDLKGRAL